MLRWLKGQRDGDSELRRINRSEAFAGRGGGETGHGVAATRRRAQYLDRRWRLGLAEVAVHDHQGNRELGDELAFCESRVCQQLIIVDEIKRVRRLTGRTVRSRVEEAVRVRIGGFCDGGDRGRSAANERKRRNIRR